LSQFLVGIATGTVRLRNLQRLIRGSIFGLCATLSGLYLAMEYHRWPHDLLFHYTPTLALLIEGSIAHWALTLYEEYAVGNTVVSESEG
jgi:hypothetical protein